jgi:hypothetical protein
MTYRKRFPLFVPKRYAFILAFLFIPDRSSKVYCYRPFTVTCNGQGLLGKAKEWSCNAPENIVHKLKEKLRNDKRSETLVMYMLRR